MTTFLYEYTILLKKTSNIQRKLLTVILTDVVLIVSPVVFIETRFFVFCTNTRTPIVVCGVAKV